VVALWEWLLYLVTAPTTFELLTEKRWCLNHISFAGKAYKPNTTGFSVVIIDACPEYVRFGKTGEIFLPGFGTSDIIGNWSLDDNMLTLSNLDNLEHVFTGDFKVEIAGTKMNLESDNTTIFCSQIVY